MELLKSNDKNELRHTDFYTAYNTIMDLEIYDYNIRYYDEEFVMKLFTKIKTQKVTAGTKYRLHSNYILFLYNSDKLQKQSLETYKEYLEYCVSNQISHIPESEPAEKETEGKAEAIAKKFRNALDLPQRHRRTAYDLCAEIGKKVYEVIICKEDCLALYLSKKTYLKYQNMASKAFKIKREFLTTVFSPIENFEKMYCKMINALSMQLLFKNNTLFCISNEIHHVYIIKKGEIELSYKKGEGYRKLTPVLRCTRGSLVGDFEILNRRAVRYLKATVLSSECIVYCIQVEYFKLLLNLSKTFRNKIIMQAKEKYAMVANITTNEVELARTFSTKRLPFKMLRGSALNIKKKNVNNKLDQYNQAEDHKPEDLDSTPLKPQHHKEDHNTEHQTLLKSFLRRKDDAVCKFAIKSIRLESSEREAKLHRFNQFSLSNYIDSTIHYVANHQLNNKRRCASKVENADDFYLEEKKAVKSINTKSDSKIVAKHTRSNSYKYFANFLQKKFTDYNSYYNTVTNPNHLPTPQPANIERIKERLERGSVNNFLIQ